MDRSVLPNVMCHHTDEELTWQTLAQVHRAGEDESASRPAVAPPRDE